MSIFGFSDFREFLNTWFDNQPARGRGQRARMSKALGISPTMMSQILGGAKSISLEHAVELCEHIGLNDQETDYFLLLVGFDRAGSSRLRNLFRAKIVESQRRAALVSSRIQTDKELTPEIKSVYYSSWTYTGIRNLTAIEGFGDIESIAVRLGLSKAVVRRVVDFLLQHGLCRKEEDKIQYNTKWTHIGNDSTLVVKHHQNWRLRGMSKMEDPTEEKLFFTGPMSMSNQVADKIRVLIPDWIESVQKLVSPSSSETVRCLNIDWFEY